MVLTKYLSDSEKKEGQKNLYHSEVFNGLGFSMLGDTIVYILAVQFNAGNLALGYIASAMYIVGIVLPVMASLFRHKNVVKVQTVTWVLRGVVSIGYLPLLWLEGNRAVTLLLVVYTLFCLMRLVGAVLYDYTFKTITSNKTRGKVIGNANVAFQSSTIIAKFLNFIITSIRTLSGVIGLVSLQMFGVIMNTIAALFLSKIPCRATIEYKKGRNLFVIFKEAMRDKDARIRLLVFWSYMSVTVVMGMSIAFLSKEVALPSNVIFLYTIAVSFSVVLAGNFCKFFSDRLGSRPLIVANGIGLVLSLVLWVLIPPTHEVYLFFVLGFLTNFFLAVVSILIRRLLASVIPDDEAVGFNSMTNFVVAIFALFSGLLGGYLASLGAAVPYRLSLLSVDLGNTYYLTFSLALVFSVSALIFTIAMKEKGSLSTKDATQLMFSFHGIRAFINIDKLEKVTDPIKRKSLLLSLGKNLTGVATSEIRSNLANPFYNDKAEVIRGLFDRPRVALVNELVQDAFCFDSYTQLESIFALGALVHNEKAEHALVYLLEKGDVLVRSTAAKSLARVTKNSRYLDRVTALSDGAETILEELNFLIAKNIMDSDGAFFEDLFLAARQGRSAAFRQTRYTLLAYFLKVEPPLGDIYEQKNLLHEDFLIEFLEESRDVAEIDQQRGAILSAFEHREWSRIWAICFAMTRSLIIDSPRFHHVNAAIQEAQTMPRAQTDGDDALAALYFSYQVKKKSH
ncbi:MAG: MFS transporter [Sphaerochaetaceae bacterium]|nr:MFS transporter [Sphaerochaetaceae bacterium]